MAKTRIDGKQDVWIAADYHMSSNYSCRMVMSSLSSTLALPASGPATIRLGAIRSSIERFGYQTTRDVLFSIICSVEICIKPPSRIGISTQKLKAYKIGSRNSVVQSIVYREFAQCEGYITIYMKVPVLYKSAISSILKGISYWGQANSFTSCMNISEMEPTIGECAIALEKIQAPYPLQGLFSCFLTEFANKEIEWESIMPNLNSGNTTFLKTVLFLWPLTIKQHGTSKVLQRHSLEIDNK